MLPQRMVQEVLLKFLIFLDAVGFDDHANGSSVDLANLNEFVHFLHLNS